MDNKKIPPVNEDCTECASVNDNIDVSQDTEQKEKKAAKPRATSAKQEKRVEPPKDREEPKTVPQVAARTPIPEATLATLTPAQKTILEAIPDDGTLSADAIYALDLPRADLMAALTMLEIMGLVQKLPGSLYKKA